MRYVLPNIDHYEGRKYIIYGAGEVAKQYYSQMKARSISDFVELFVETQPTKNQFMDKAVISYEELKQIKWQDYCFIIASCVSASAIEENLINLGVSQDNIVKPNPPIYNMALRRNIPTVKNLIFYPLVSEDVELENLITRLKWYLPDTREMNVQISIFSNLKPLSLPTNVKLIDTDKVSQFIEESDIILVWNKKVLDDEMLQAHKQKVYCVDPTFYSTVESQTYRTLYYVCLEDNVKKEYEDLSKKNYQDFIDKNKNKTKAYLFGTGPSLERAFEFNYSGGLNIVCNSIVKNLKLLDYIGADLLVFADPVFHFSPCEYSKQFRQDLLMVMERYNDLYCMIPDYNVSLMLAHYPQLKDRIIGMPSINADYNFPMTDMFYTKHSSNILTLYMVPVASAIAQEIFIIGCDGRQKTENYFWKHNQNVQYGDLMKTVFDMHPSFFADRVYEDYYDEHCEFLEKLIEYGEGMGKKYYSLTPSFIPVLEKRLYNK